jgi:hypothetical protein
MYHIDKEISGNGENITLENTADYKFKEFNIGGNSKQETREGYNLLDLSNFSSSTKNGVTITKNANGSITFNGNCTTGFGVYTSINLTLPAGNYINSIKTPIVALIYFSLDSTSITMINGSTATGSTYKSFTLTEEKTYSNYSIWIDKGAVLSNFTIYPMVCEGATEKDYEPYGASPSPDYPSEVESCGDNVNLFDKNNANILNTSTGGAGLGAQNSSLKTLYIPITGGKTYTVSKISSTRFGIITTSSVPTYNVSKIDTVTILDLTATKATIVTTSSAKYLCVYYYNSGSDTLSEETIRNSIKIEPGSVATPYSEYGQGNINVEICNKNLFVKDKALAGYFLTTTGDLTVNDYWKYIIIRGKKSQNYRVEGITSPNDSIGAVELDKNKSFIKSLITYKNGTFTTDEDCEYIGISCRNDEIETFQLHEGTTYNDYIEGKSQTYTIPTQQPFRKIGDYKDEFILKNNKWYERHYINRYAVTGKENWIMQTTWSDVGNNTNAFYWTHQLTNFKRTDNNISSHFKLLLSIASTDEIGFSMTTNLIIRVSKNITNVDDLKTFLSEQYNAGTPLYVDYVLETPIEIECTEEQSEVLWDIYYNAKTYDKVTHIYSTDAVSPIFDVIAYKGITNDFKNRLLTGKITRAYMKVLPTDTLPELIINESNYLKDITFEEERYVPDEGFIGGAVAKSVSGNFNNVDNSFSIQDREFELYFGVDMDDEGTETEYIKYGTFIVQKPEDNQVNDNTSFEALDYMIILNTAYVDRVTYPCTLKELFDDVVAQSGLGTKVTSFLNDDFIVENNQFEEGTTLRQVLKAIAQVAFNWIRIDEDNEIVMDFEYKDAIDEELNEDNYYDLTTNEKYGPINTIVLKNSQIEGENVTISDEDSINGYGVTELAISDNPFAYTQEKRTELIKAGKKIFGLTYIPVSMNMIGYIYLNCKDKIKIKTLQDEYLDTYILNHTIKYDGVALDSMESPAMTKTETQYQYISSVSQAIKHTELLVDKANQRIDATIERQDDTDNKLVEISADIESVSSKIVTQEEITTQINAVAQTINGTTSSIIKSGGNNIFYYATDYWTGETENSSPTFNTITNTNIKQNTISGIGYILNNGASVQKQTVINGAYTISFKYYKMISLATAYVLINNTKYTLDADNINTWYEKTIKVDIDTNTINIDIVADTNNSFYFADLMVNTGSEKLVWSQNANETITDDVTIGKGIQVNSSTTNTYTRIDADGNRIYKTGTTSNPISEFTDKGIETEELIVRSQATINLLLIQEIDSQTWLTGLGG